MKKGKKVVALGLALVTLAVGIGGGTLAWLTDKTDEVKNVFTDSGIGVTLTETKQPFKMVPGWTIEKDPVVTVEAESEDCYVFIKVEESDELKDYITYAIDSNNWTKLEGETGVYYCIATDITADRKIKVLGSGTYTDEDGVSYSWEPQHVLTKPEVTESMMEALTTDSYPTLTFTAYAVQLWKTNKPDNKADYSEAQFTPEQAWAKVNSSSSGNTTETGGTN